MERVLVCLLASTRSHQVTFPSFQKHVLDELNADLAVALLIDDKYDYGNPFWQRAKYRWTAPVFADYGEAFDLAQRRLCQERKLPPPDWRIMLQVKGIWQGGIASPSPQKTLDGRLSFSALLPFCRWLLLHGLQEDGVLDRYDRFVITRSDFLWLCPHPPLSVLDRDALWFPDGEHWGGLNDRHLVASRNDIAHCLNALEEILLHPSELHGELKDRELNDEQFLSYHLARQGILHKRKFFPYVMYLVRAPSDKSPTFKPGRYEPAAGHFVRYETEFRSARAFATIIHSRADWERDEWRQFRAESVAPPEVPVRRRLWYIGKCLYYDRSLLLGELSQPARLERLVRYIRRTTH